MRCLQRVKIRLRRTSAINIVYLPLAWIGINFLSSKFNVAMFRSGHPRLMSWSLKLSAFFDGSRNAELSVRTRACFLGGVRI